MLAVSAMTMMSPTTMMGQNLKYPAAPKDNTVDEYFGIKVADPFRPLEDDTCAATAAWAKAENAVTDAYLAKIPQRNKYLKRLKQVANYEKVYTPFEKNGKWYVYKNNGLQNQAVLYQMDKLGGEARVFLDPNKLSDDGTVALKGISFSNDGKYLAYTISRSGSDWEEIYVMDVKTQKLLPDHIVWAKFTGADWQGDGFYYSAYDAPEKGKETSAKNEIQKVYYHKMGTPQSQDQLFYQNPANPLRFYGVGVNKEETMMFLTESGMDQGINLFVRDLRQPNSQFIQMTGDCSKTYSPVEIIGDDIYYHSFGYDDAVIKNKVTSKNRSLSAGQVLLRDYDANEIETIIRSMAIELSDRMYDKKVISNSFSMHINFSQGGGLSFKLFTPLATASHETIGKKLASLFLKDIDKYREKKFRGVYLCANDIYFEDTYQLSLFDSEEKHDRQIALEKTTKEIRKLYGVRKAMPCSALNFSSTFLDRSQQIGGHHR